MELFKQNMLAANAPAVPDSSDTAALQAPRTSTDGDSADGVSAIQTRVYRFSNLDQVSDAANAVQTLGIVQSKLYKKPGTSQYYLVLSSQSADPVSFSRVCNLLAEYGEKIRTDVAGEAHYQEHYEVIIGADALQKLALI